MGTTGSGYPYPENSDPVAEGAQAIKALAEAVNDQLRNTAAGHLADVHLTSDSVGSVAVTFPSGRFGGVPTVVATCDSSTYFAAVGTVTTGGTTLWARHYQGTADTTTVTVRWIASS